MPAAVVDTTVLYAPSHRNAVRHGDGFGVGRGCD